MVGEFHLSTKFHHKLIKAIEYEHNSKNTDFDEVIEILPRKLKTALRAKMYESELGPNLFFDSQPVEFLSACAAHLKPQMFDSQDLIYRTDEVATEMFFIVSGEVGFQIVYQSQTITYHTIETNYYFGEVELLVSS
jgi:hypothetical protein